MAPAVRHHYTLSPLLLSLIFFVTQRNALALLTPTPFITSRPSIRLGGYAFDPSLSRHIESNKGKLSFLNRHGKLSTTTALCESEGKSEPVTKSKIPKEYRDEIYLAESRTVAAQGRQSRIVGYAAAAFFFLSLGVGNVSLTTMRQLGVDLDAEGYGWTQSIWFLGNTFGGYFDIILAGVFGTLVELENRARDETAEKIWEEMERRREIPKKRKEKVKEKRKSRKQSKRLSALAEVILEDEESNEVANTIAVDTNKSKEAEKEKKGGNIFDKAKEMYQRADSMAASSALLLNKELEDRGVLEKITDESGLKVIGKEAAAELKAKSNKVESNERVETESQKSKKS